MIKLVIFDLDGVLVDARELHYEALNRALAGLGFTITRDEHLSTYDGLPTTKKLELLTENKGLQKENYDLNRNSKETFILVNNWFMMFYLITVLLGTIYPIFTDALTDNKISVGPPFYNAIIFPVVVVFLLFMALGPKAKWIKNKFENIKIYFLILAGAISLNLAIIFFFKSYSLLSNFIIISALFLIISSLMDTAKALKKNKLDCVINLAYGIGTICEENPLQASKINIVGTTSIFEMIVKYKIRRLVFASSETVYGAHQEFYGDKAVTENDYSGINNHFYTYGVMKLLNEFMAEKYIKKYGTLNMVHPCFIIQKS